MKTSNRHHQLIVPSGVAKSSLRKSSALPSDVRKRSALPARIYKRTGASPRKLGAARVFQCQIAGRPQAFRTSDGTAASLPNSFGRSIRGALVLLFVFAMTAPGQSSGGNFQITKSVVAGGGDQSGAGNFSVTGTAGQPAAGALMQQGPFSQTGGFWPDGAALTQSNIATNDIVATYGGTATLTATLTANGVNLSGQPVSFSLNGAGVGVATTDTNGIATLNNVSLSGINAGSYPGAVTVQFIGDLTFTPSTVAGQLTVQPATPQLQVAGGSFTFDGQAHAAAVTLTGISNEVLGPVVVLYNGSNSLPVNAGSYSVNASFAGNQNYAAATNNLQGIVINKANQAISFAGLANKSFGAADFAVGATASSNLAVSFGAFGDCTISGNTLHLTGAGLCTVTASQTGDINHDPAPDVSRAFNIGKGDQAINFAAPANRTFADQDFEVGANASSGLAVSFAASGSCTLNGNTVHLSGAGVCMLTASQAGDRNYNAAPDVNQSFSIAKANQTINFAVLPSLTFGDADFNLNVAASSGLSVSLAASGQCTVNGAQLHILAAGSCTLTASQAGDVNYEAATDVSRSFSIGKANQTINFGAFPDKTFGDADFSVTATASSSLSVGFGASGSCSISGATVHLTRSGVCTVTASQAGDANYNAATDVPQTFSVEQASSTTTLTSSRNPSELGQSVTFTANVGSTAGIPTGTVEFKDNGASLGAPVALNASAVATLTTSSLTTGPHAISAIYSGDQNFTSSIGALAGSQVVGSQLALSINDVTLAEGNNGNTSFIFTVTLSSAGSLPVTVDYATADGTAMAGSDYQPASGSLTFAPGDTQKTITVLVSGDTVNEPDANFFVNLSNPTNAAITHSQGVGLIVNDDTPGFRLAASSYTVSEDGVDAVLTVVRGGDLSKPATVDYATSDQAGDAPCSVASGFASQRCDYEITVRTLQFAAGESTRTILVPIIDDTYVEGPETFNVTLSNPTGAVLGSISSAAVTIVDNDSVAGFLNPIDDSAFFVRMHYLDFLNREPDPAGFTFWVNNIDSCGADANCRAAKRVDTSAAFFLSIEYQQTGYLVYRTYLAAFGKMPQAPVTLNWNQFVPDTQAVGQNLVVNQTGWEQALEQNKQEFMSRFVRRSQFASALPMTMAPGDFVSQLFRNADLRASDSELQAAINEFGGALDTRDMAARARTLRRVAENALLCQKEMDRAFVLMQYFGYLRRNPNAGPDSDFSGYNFWLQKLDSFNGNYVDAEMVRSFLVSREYRQRFSQQ